MVQILFGVALMVAVGCSAASGPGLPNPTRDADMGLAESRQTRLVANSSVAASPGGELALASLEDATPVLAPGVALPEVPSPTLLESCDETRTIVIFKAARQLELRCGDALAARYPISLGFAPVGHKLREGDGRTPEGEYFVDFKFVSQFHRSLQIAYPNARDADQGLSDGTINQAQHDRIVAAVNGCRRPPQNTMLGSNIQIHGLGGGPEAGDWTLGCVALDNDPIEAVFAFHQAGCQGGRPRTIVRILP